MSLSSDGGTATHRWFGLRSTAANRSIVNNQNNDVFDMALQGDAVDRISAYYRSDGIELRDASSSEAWLFAADPVEIEQ